MDVEARFHFEFEQENDNEIFVNWFPEKIIDHAGETIELPPNSAVFGAELTDEDLPF